MAEERKKNRDPHLDDWDMRGTESYQKRTLNHGSNNKHRVKDNVAVIRTRSLPQAGGLTKRFDQKNRNAEEESHLTTANSEDSDGTPV